MLEICVDHFVRAYKLATIDIDRVGKVTTWGVPDDPQLPPGADFHSKYLGLEDFVSEENLRLRRLSIDFYHYCVPLLYSSKEPRAAAFMTWQYTPKIVCKI